MEGTSGAADLAPLRGGTGEAALGSLEAGRPAQAGWSSTSAQAGGPRKRAPVQTGAKSRAARARRKRSPWGGIAEAFVPHVAHAGWAPGGAGVSSRRCYGPTTGGARADRVGAKLPLRVPSGAPYGRRHPSPPASSAGRNGWPLTRENSVGVVVEARFRHPARGACCDSAPRPACRSRGAEGLGPQGSHSEAKARKGRVGSQGLRRKGDRGGGATWPCRAWRATSGRSGQGSGDRRLCSRAVLVAEVDERRRVHAFGHGSSPQPHARAVTRWACKRTPGLPGAVLPCAEGRFASRKGVKRRRSLLATETSRGSQGAAACMRWRTCGYARQRCRVEGQAPRDADLTGHAGNCVAANVSNAEGALGDGRRPGPAPTAAFDEAAREARAWRQGGVVLIPRRGNAWRGRGSGGGSRQRAPEVTSRARFAAEKAAAGRRSAEELPIAAPPGPRSVPFLDEPRGFGSARTPGTVVDDG
jgi:hypothetical protein